MFLDTAKIFIKSGKGGNGVVVELEVVELVIEFEVQVQAVAGAAFLDDDAARHGLIDLFRPADNQRQFGLRLEGGLFLVPLEVDVREQELDLQGLGQFAVLAKGHAALVAVVFGLAQNVVQCEVKGLVIRYIHKI